MVENQPASAGHSKALRGVPGPRVIALNYGSKARPVAVERAQVLEVFKRKNFDFRMMGFERANSVLGVTDKGQPSAKERIFQAQTCLSPRFFFTDQLPIPQSGQSALNA